MKKRFLGIAMILGLGSAVAFAQEEQTGADSTVVKADFAQVAGDDSTKIEIPAEEVNFACSAAKDTTATEKAELFAQEGESTEVETPVEGTEKAELFAQEGESTEVETPAEGTEKAELFA